MTDRQLLAHLGRAVVATLALVILVVTGIAYAELTATPPQRVVQVGQPR